VYLLEQVAGSIEDFHDTLSFSLMSQLSNKTSFKKLWHIIRYVIQQDHSNPAVSGSIAKGGLRRLLAHQPWSIFFKFLRMKEHLNIYQVTCLKLSQSTPLSCYYPAKVQDKSFYPFTS